MLGVGDRVADDVLQEDLEDAAGFLVDETGDALHAATASQTTDSGLGDALDVIAKNLAMALGSTLSETLATLEKKKPKVSMKSGTAKMETYLATARHVD